MEDGRMSPLALLSRRVRDASDEAADPGPLIEAASRRALAGRGAAAKARPRAARRRVTWALAIAAAALMAWVALAPRRPSVTYAIGEASVPGPIGAWIAAEQAPMPIRFSEGTVVTLSSGSRARVTRADADGASVLLERGALRAGVVHASAATRWRVQAGPFEVAVVGTDFDLAWDPGGEVLDLHLLEGRVVVSGPLLGGGRTLDAGERLRVSVREQRSEVERMPGAERASLSRTPGAVAPAAPRPSENGALVERGAAAEQGAAAENGAAAEEGAAPENGAAAEKGAAVEKGVAAEKGAAAARPAAVEAAQRWRTLAAAGRHREAMVVVEQEGFERVLAGADAGALLELADAARYAGELARARAALLGARELGARGRSAFLLGKIAADHGGDPGSAAAWFKTYLDEAPGGGLAEQALGRLIELRRRAGDAAGARAAAEVYLQRYPHGAYAALAEVAVAP